MKNGTINQKNLWAKLKKATRPDMRLIEVASATGVDLPVLSKFVNHKKELTEESAQAVYDYLLMRARGASLQKLDLAHARP